MKRLLALLLLCVCLLSFTSCALFSDLSDLEFEDDYNLLTYNGNSYYRTDARFVLYIESEDEIVELGHRVNWPVFPTFYYLAFEKDSPLFISGAHDDAGPSFYLYVRSDFDLENATYLLEGTDLNTLEGTNIEVHLSDIMTDIQPEYIPANYDPIYDLDIYFTLKDEPRLRARFMGPYQYEENWYVSSYGDKDYPSKDYLLSDEFVAQLKASGIIKE